jgi:hypothetical protein
MDTVDCKSVDCVLGSFKSVGQFNCVLSVPIRIHDFPSVSCSSDFELIEPLFNFVYHYMYLYINNSRK